MACDADSHYMCNAMPYLGKQTVDQKEPAVTLGEHFTVKLTEPYAHLGHTVTTNNSFTSLPLALTLRKCGLELVGAIRQKPYLPSQVLEHSMGIGESVAVYNYEDKVTLLCSRPNRTKRVQLLSTIHHRPAVIERGKTDVQMLYGATKGAVETFDQLCSAVDCSRRTRRWTLRMFYGMVNIAVVNGYIIYSQLSGTKGISRKDFYKTVAEQLCRPWVNVRLNLHRTLPRELQAMMSHVFDLPVPHMEPNRHSQKTEKRKRCYICPRDSNIKTRLLCQVCNRSVCSRHVLTTCLACYS